MKKVSVIIPMYNAERTIKECLDSIMAQTIFTDMEIVIVDDCSTDKSSEIAENYEAEYPANIILIRLEENAGPGSARNVAMEYASGEYIGFVDADDAIQPTMYEKLYDEAVRTKADYVDSGFYDQKKDRAIIFVSDELAGRLDSKKKSGLIISGGYIWSKLFKRSFLTDHEIRFREEYVLEDMDFLIECTVRAEIIGNVKEILYVYRNSNSSLSKTSEHLKYIHNQLSAMKAIYDKTHMVPEYDGIRDAVEFVMLRLYSNVVNTCMNMVFLNEQSEEEMIPMLRSVKQLKDSIITGDYDNEYIHKGISKTDLAIIKANDESPETALGMQKMGN